MNANEHDDAATPRAGGDVIWKSASQASPAESADENSNTASPDTPQSGTRAGGDVIIKGGSQDEPGKGQ
jgi:hypothetical protein